MSEVNNAVVSEVSTSQSQSNSKSTVQLIYILYAVGFLFGLTYLVAGIMAVIKKGDEQDVVLKSHLEYQARTFWFSLAWFILGMLTAVFLVGYVILLVNYVWALYRVIKGWLAFNEMKSV